MPTIPLMARFVWLTSWPAKSSVPQSLVLERVHNGVWLNYLCSIEGLESVRTGSDTKQIAAASRNAAGGIPNSRKTCIT